MKKSINIIFTIISIFILNNSLIKASEEPKSGEAFYVADVTEGYIGTFKDKPIDSPTDNVFTVVLDKQPEANDEVWLSYELYGITNHSGVSRSINNQLAIGGQLIGANDNWQQQEERINPEWLKEGENIIRFAQAAEAYNYKVRNLGFKVKQSNDAERKIIINQPETQEYTDKWGYTKGFIKGCGSQSVQLYANGEPIETFDSEFEVLTHHKDDSENWTVSLKAIFADGESIEETVDFNTHTALKRSKSIPFPAASHVEMAYIPGQEFIAHLDEVEISIAPNALQNNTNISITALRNIDLPPLDVGMVNVTKNEEAYRFLPHGTQFDEAAKIKLAYDESKIPTGYTVKDIKTYYFDETVKHWIALPLDSINTVLNTVVSKTTHFTDMINGIIKVPESPETGAFTPTSIKDIKAADPSANINTIEPPSANNMGTANVGYPIVIPLGRQGMQPQLGIQYSSGGGNDWLGLGWNLSIPKITVETRWGVPRYGDIEIDLDGDGQYDDITDTNENNLKDDVETETYLLNGEQLAPTAHLKGEFVQRQADKQFYPRVEGNFQKIIRRGDSPTNYTWEVKDKSGTVYYYGGINGTIVNNAILRADNDYNNYNEGNDDDPKAIACWNLVKVEDIHGNYVSYKYNKPMDTGVECLPGEDCTLDPGYNTYISEITYTGYGEQPGKYKVIFKTDRDLREEYNLSVPEKREDVIIDCRYGLKKVTADLLKRIDVKYNGQYVRAYELYYEEGQFHKTLLKHVIEYDASFNPNPFAPNTTFSKHKFEYYNDVIDENEQFKPLGEEEQWTTGDSDNVVSGLSKIISGLGSIVANIPGVEGTEFGDKLANLNNASSLGTSKSDGFGFGGAVTLGVGFWQSKDKSAGLSGGYDHSENDGVLALIDLNGDGLPDKIFKRSGEIYFKPNITSSDFESAVFGQEELLNIPDFSVGKSNTGRFGVEAQFGIQFAYQYSTTTNRNSTYFTDANGDQLIDLVVEGVVYFNRLDENNIPTFELSSAGSACQVCTGEEVYQEEIDPEDLQINPLHDPVKVWIAPYDGAVRIHAPVTLLESDEPSGTADGVKVNIQHNNTNLWTRTIGPYGSSNAVSQVPSDDPMNPNINYLSQSVTKGDRIYFRAHSIFDGTNDEVQWKPTITYMEGCNCSYALNSYTITPNNAGNSYNLTLSVELNNVTNNTFSINIDGQPRGSYTDTFGDGTESITINNIPNSISNSTLVIYDESNETCTSYFNLNTSNCYALDAVEQNTSLTCGGSEVEFTVSLESILANNQQVVVESPNGTSTSLPSIGSGQYQGLVSMPNTTGCVPEQQTFTIKTYCTSGGDIETDPNYGRIAGINPVIIDEHTVQITIYPNPAHLAGFFDVEISEDGCTATLSEIPGCESYFSWPIFENEWTNTLDPQESSTTNFQYVVNYPTELINSGCYEILGEISVNHTCNSPLSCANEPGLMQTSQTYICYGETEIFGVAFAYPDANSIIGYVLHEGEFFNPITSNIIDFSQNGEFESPGSSYHNTPLYITAVTGYPDANGFPQLDHECTVWAPYGAYVIFLNPVDITPICDGCQNGAHYVSVSVNGGVGGIFPNAAYVTVSDGSTSYTDVSADETLTFGPYSGQGSYEIVVTDAKGCEATLSGAYDCSVNPQLVVPVQNPVITIPTLTATDDPFIGPCIEKDANGLRVYQFKADEDFLLSSSTGTVIPMKGTINLSGKMFKDLTSDEVVLDIRIIRQGENQPAFTLETTYQDSNITIPNGQDIIPQNNIAVEENDILYVNLYADSTIDWTEVKFEPEIMYEVDKAYYDLNEAFNSEDILNPLHANSDNTDNNVLNVTVNHLIFNRVIQPTKKWVAQEEDAIFVFPKIIGNASGVTFTIKKELELLVKDDNQLDPFYLVSDVQVDDELWFDFHFEDEVQPHEVWAYVQIYHNGIISNHPAGIFSTTDNYLAGLTGESNAGVENKDAKLFGNVYRNWGQFIYYENDEDAPHLIDENEMADFLTQNWGLNVNDDPDEMLESLEEEMAIDLENVMCGVTDQFDLDDINDFELNDEDIEVEGGLESNLSTCLNGMQGLLDGWLNSYSLHKQFIHVFPNMVKQHYQGSSPFININEVGLASSRYGNPDILLSPYVNTEIVETDGDHGLVAIKTKSKSNNNTFNIGPLNLSFGGTKQKFEYIDMNGDRHPDIVSSKNIQYTLPTGGLAAVTPQSQIEGYEDQVQKSKHLQFGATAGGNLPLSSDQSSGNRGRSAEASDSEIQAKASCGLSGGFGANFDRVKYDNLDINGDGLPDRVYKNGDVQLNYGYRFGQKEKWDYTHVNKGRSFSGNIGGNLGINIDANSFSAGIGSNFGANKVIDRLIDVNGDGLLDKISAIDDPPECPQYIKDLGELTTPNENDDEGGDGCTLDGCYVEGTILVINIPDLCNGYDFENQDVSFDIEIDNADGFVTFLPLPPNGICNDINTICLNILTDATNFDLIIKVLDSQSNIIATINLQMTVGCRLASGEELQNSLLIPVSENIDYSGFLPISDDPTPLVVSLNTGNGFGEPIPWNGAEFISKGNSIGESANGAGTVCIPIFPPFPVKLCFNVSGNKSGGVSKEKLQIKDMNGDGFPDYVTTNPEVDNDHQFNIKRSTINRTNMLKKVERPLGGHFTLDYRRIGNTLEMPNDVWALSSVIVDDGFTSDGANHIDPDATSLKGADQMLNTFEYEDGYFHRCEREFYGFKKVRTHQRDVLNNEDPETGEPINVDPVSGDPLPIYEVQVESVPLYRTVEQTFINNTENQFTSLDQIYYAKGLLKDEVLMDKDGFIYKRTDNYYSLRERIEGLPSYFPALVLTDNEFFERPVTGATIPSKLTTTTFDYDEFGNIIYFEDYGDTGDEDDYYTTITYHTVDNMGGDLVDKNLTGLPQSIAVTNNSNNVLRKRETEVFPTGKIAKIKQYIDLQTDPAEFDMTYDQYGNIWNLRRPINEEGDRLSFGYQYDNEVHTYPVTITDSYGYTSTSAYDYSFGQLTSTTDLNGNEMNYTLDDAGRIETIIGPLELANNIDYTIKFQYHPNANVPYAETFHYDPANPGNDLKTVTLIDGLKRPIQVKKDIEYTPATTSSFLLQLEQMSVSGRILYDAFGRTVAGYHPIRSDLEDANLFNEELDEVAPTQTTYDVLDRPTQITLPDGTSTSNQYSIGNIAQSGESFITKITDANGHWKRSFTNIRNLTTATQEQLTDDEANAIWTRFYYNAINELMIVKDHDDNEILYDYDMLGRKLSMDHPDGGLTTFEYDLASNLTKKITANLRAISDQTAIEYKYYQERLTNIIYPQHINNNVTYKYGEAGADENGAGRIIEQTDATGTQTFGYNELGALVRNNRTVILGDQDGLAGGLANDCMDIELETIWEYDTWNRIKTLTYPDGEVVNYQYNTGGLLKKMTGTLNGETYDYIDNLGYDEFEQRVHLQYGNTTTTKYTYEAQRRRLNTLTAFNGTANFIQNTYGYDNENNISSIKNEANGQSVGGTTDYSFIYDEMNRLTHADGNHTDDQVDIYSLDMVYGSTHTIISKQQTHTKDDAVQSTEYGLEYNYENEDHPHAVSSTTKNNNLVTTYTYDANGNMYDETTEVQCDVPSIRRFRWDEENRLRLVADNGAIFKYIYDAAGERVIKNTGPGSGLWINGRIPQQTGPDDPVDPFDPTNGDVTCLEQYTVYVNPYVVVRNGEVTKHYYIENQRIASKLTGTMQADSEIEVYNDTPVFYFHPDHLGNSSYITDLNGEITQHVEYFPFGEVFIEQNANSYATPYKYNGKELDSETGLYYYGARYYNPELSLWLSVDPMAGKYPRHSPYNYTLNNPLAYSDPDGRNPARVAKMFIKIGWNTYRKLRKAGNFNRKNFMKALKDSGLQEVMDLAGDLYTIVAPESNFVDRGKAAFDIVTGFETNNKGNKAVKDLYEKHSTKKSSRAARREAMRDEGIPTSQTPKSQSKNDSGREYQYEVPNDGGGTQIKSVQQQTMDRSHTDQPHWEAGKVKTNDNGQPRYNDYDRPKLSNDKSKINYNDGS